MCAPYPVETMSGPFTAKHSHLGREPALAAELMSRPKEGNDDADCSGDRCHCREAGTPERYAVAPIAPRDPESFHNGALQEAWSRSKNTASGWTGRIRGQQIALESDRWKQLTWITTPSIEDEPRATARDPPHRDHLPISHAFPPGPGPSGTRRLTIYERLVSMGHDVTSFAPAGSITSATLVDTVRARLDSSSADRD